MKKKKGLIRQTFGVSQTEMAVLLQISLGQWSMFESGKRDLPPKAKMQFAAMLTHIQSEEALAKGEPGPIQPDEKTTKKLKFALLVNQHRQLITAKK